jgi:RNA polymerase sigma factor (TIGR02999 family)
MSQVTRLLDQARQGDARAAGDLLPLVYDELRRLAARKMASERPGHTLQPTALVHEAWMRLVGDQAFEFENTMHFYGVAAEAMRRILVESARRKKRIKHGGQLERVDLTSLSCHCLCQMTSFWPCTRPSNVLELWTRARPKW